MIRLVDAVKIYNSKGLETIALNHVNLTIESGDLVALVGPSGSGKSTLLNIVGGMDRLTSGQYYYFDKEVSKLTSNELHEFRKNHISFIFQNFELLNYYTVYENIEMPLIARNIGKTQRKQIILDVTDRLGIIDLKDKYPNELSGGQKQRVAIARAIACNTDLILADEPTGALDKANGKIVMDILKELNKEGKTIVVITHDLSIAGLCNRSIHLDDGEVYD